MDSTNAENHLLYFIISPVWIVEKDLSNVHFIYNETFFSDYEKKSK